MGPQDDRWMTRWLPAMREAAADGAVLELGCDTGGDTAWLLAQGFDVTAGDISLDALRTCQMAAPTARLLQFDLREPLPLVGASFGVVVASLCLHYFDWATTVRAVNEVRRCLAPGGLLLVRVNSTRDVLHGAEGFEAIEPHYYRVNGRYAECKRFFDRPDLERLFAAWDWLACEEGTIHRYAEPKVCWELAARKAGQSPA